MTSRRWGRTAIVAAALGLLLLAALVQVGLLRGKAPRHVLVVYVREENSLGLRALPAPEGGPVPLLDAAGTRARLPERWTGWPARTRTLVLRETYVAGCLVDARAIPLSGLPGLIPARVPGGGRGVSGDGLDPGDLDPSRTLLAVDLVLKNPDRTGVGPGELRLEAPGLTPASLAPGQEWQVAAVRRGEVVAILGPADPGYADSLREAFRVGEPVSVLSVTNLGEWDTDRIESGRDSGG